jgi:hypothetical protein
MVCKNFIQRIADIMKHTFFLLIALTVIIAGCAQESSDPQAPAKAVEKYLEARMSKDSDAFAGTFCADFESDALIDFDSFGAVEATLEDMVCEVGTISEGTANVTCTGSLKTVYNGEDSRTLDLARFPYVATQDDGEWVMCGYGE